MKVDPNSLISQFIDYHTGMITDWVKWVQLERSMRLDEFLTDYDKKEKRY